MQSSTTVVVTGAASGIGAATAQLYAGQGATVLAVDIDEAGLTAQVQAAAPLAGEVRPVPLDVADRERVLDVLGAATVDGLHVLVNCAASFIARGLDVTTEDWERVLGVNLRGISNVVQACHPALAWTDGAAVVNVASISARIAQRGRWTYNATKGAIVSLTRCQALDLAADGVRVNSVSPGWIWTPEVARAAEGDRQRWEPVWGDYHMLRRLGEPREVAAAIAFLCSPAASFITGADLPVDGGYLAMGPEGLGGTATFAGSA